MTTLPNGWAMSSLASIATINPPPPQELADDFLISFVPMASVEAESGRMNATEQRPVAEVRRKSYRSFAEGDVLFAKVTPCMENGKIALASGLANGIGFGSSEFHVVRPCDGIVAKYLMHFLLQKQFRDDARRSMSGTAGLLRVPSKFLEAADIPVPPTKEQERIVAAIEEQFSRLDAGVTALDSVRRNLARMRASVLQAAITGGLFLERQSTTRPGVLPKSWRRVRVEDIAEVTGGITKNPKRKPLRNPIPFLRVANVPRDALDLSDVHEIEVFDGELERLRLRSGDLLVVEGNGSPDQIGRSALWHGEIDPCVHQNHLIRVRPGEQILPEYLNLFWNAPSSMESIQAAASSTSGLHTLSTGKVRSVPVSLPPITMQTQIVAEVTRQLSYIEQLELYVAASHARVARLRSAILAAAFAGRLVPQDYSDESASELVRSIATERASEGQKPTHTRQYQHFRTRVPA